MKTFTVTIKGTSALMQHRMTEDVLHGLLGSKAKKKKTAEVRTPREIAESHAYKTTDGQYYIPLGYVCGAFAHVASDYKQSNSARKSYKAIAGGVFRPVTEIALLRDPDTQTPLDTCEVDIRQAVNHKSGAVAVCRPRFDRWSVTFDIVVNDEILPPDLALQILQDAGLRAGIGSFRVSNGGYFGQFAVTHWNEVKQEHKNAA